ncbi:hypothetical protein FH609_023710 [Streptomyces sp. 3MP-14]|uniref:Uncharacterized protein n=1 Tax=Streptomyces mimosae TaxID=2586635 RepID=A0A5N6AEG9_9ACTN|nr:MULTISPECIES: hypothetical protein [Streptomyces]KAB8166366.1 hypothetical protein FH607_011070 [Streptomyces mimosae]KAB8174159.1 hypothetical protein FH609_023710 [Streptomyces sp. 3MP-14]
MTTPSDAASSGAASSGADRGPDRGQPFDYDFTCEVSEDFVTLPENDAPDAWRAALRELLPASDEDDLAAAAESMREVMDRFVPRNTVRTALCIGHREEQLVVGVLTFSVEWTAHESDLVIAEAIFRANRAGLFDDLPQDALTEIDTPLAKGVQGSQDTLLATRLPCGPGVSLTSLRSLKIPGSEPGLGLTLGVAAMQLVVPAPRGYTLYVSLFTPTLDHLELFGGHLARIGRTLAFDTAADRAAAAGRPPETEATDAPVPPPRADEDGAR